MGEAPPILTYFSDAKGRNELVRLIFALGHVDYENEFLGLSEYMRRRESGELPYGQLPTMKVGSTVLGQSCAIARYAAKLANLYPEDAFEAALCDAVVDTWRDMLDLFYDCVFERTVTGGKLAMVPRKQIERGPKMAMYVETSLRPAFAQLEAQLSKATGAKGFCSSGFCYADLAVFDLVTTMRQAMEPSTFEAAMRPHGRLGELVALVGAQPEIKQHLEKFPYREIRQMLAPPKAGTRVKQMVLMPLMKAVVATKYRYTSRSQDLVLPAVLFSTLGGLVGYWAAARMKR